MVIPKMIFTTPDTAQSGLVMATTLVANDDTTIRTLGFQILQAIYKTHTDTSTHLKVLMELATYYLYDYEHAEWADINDLIEADKLLDQIARHSFKILFALGDEFILLRIKVLALMIENAGSYGEEEFYSKKREKAIQKALALSKKYSHNSKYVNPKN